MLSSNDSPNTAPPTSSSPLLSSPMVSVKKRVVQTYGSRRVEAQLPDESPDADRSFGTLVDGDTSISLSSMVHPRGIDENVVSSQDTKVDEDDEEEHNPKERKHKWEWETMLKELSDSDEEGGSAPTFPIPHADRSPSPPALRDLSAKSKGKRPSVSPKKHQRLPLVTVHSGSKIPASPSVEPDASGSDADRSPPPLLPKSKRRASRRTADTSMIEDPESEAPRASSSKSRGSRLGSADVDTNDHAPPDSTKRKRKTTTSRKPTAKVNYHDTRSIGSH
jgi:hypothetical protein